MIDLTSLYEILQTSGFLHNLCKFSAQLQDPKFFYDMFQNYGQFNTIPRIWKKVAWKNLERFN